MWCLLTLSLSGLAGARHLDHLPLEQVPRVECQDLPGRGREVQDRAGRDEVIDEDEVIHGHRHHLIHGLINDISDIKESLRLEAGELEVRLEAFRGQLDDQGPAGRGCELVCR